MVDTVVDFPQCRFCVRAGSVRVGRADLNEYAAGIVLKRFGVSEYTPHVFVHKNYTFCDLLYVVPSRHST